MRQEYDDELAKIPENTPIVYLDESGIDTCLVREKGRSKRGKKIFVKTKGKKFKRLNVISAIINNVPIGEATYDCKTNSHWFEAWFQFWLCPKLPENSLIIMDNAAFHRKKQLKIIADIFGFKLLFLPAYSPDKNPIEHFWANMKRWLRKFMSDYKTLQEALKAYFTAKKLNA